MPRGAPNPGALPDTAKHHKYSASSALSVDKPTVPAGHPARKVHYGGDSWRNPLVSAGGFADSYVSDVGVEVVGVDVLPLFEGFDYVKMDIEGSEWPILYDQRWVDSMRSVAVFALEWHERCSLSNEPRAAAISAIDAAGFVFEASPPGWNHGLIWGWRPTTPT